MFRTLALLCLVAASALGVWEGALKVTFGISTAIGTDIFIELPVTEREVIASRWVSLVRPDGPTGLEVLELWCSSTDYTICVLLDDTGYIAGLQIAIDVDEFSDSIYDWSEQGFTYWTVEDANGDTKNYWTIQQYYISAESLTIDADTRIAQRDASLMLQDEAIWVPGFNGTLYAIPTNITELTSDTNFTEQACIPWMGQHYYYNMSADLECSAETLLPWFPLTADDQLIGVGLIMYGNLTVSEGSRYWFENPTSTVVKAIVPRGPDCLYELADTPGLVTLHTYFIRHPYFLTCLL